MCSNGVTAIEYQYIIKKSGMFETLDQSYGEGKYTFMQDGAPAHNAGCTKMFLKKRCSFIARWPANSPDLNHIEHLWGAIKRILKTKEINSKTELIHYVNEIWESFPQEEIDRLVSSFRARLYAVINQNGHMISTVIPYRAYLLTLIEIIISSFVNQ